MTDREKIVELMAFAIGKNAGMFDTMSEFRRNAGLAASEIFIRQGNAALKALKEAGYFVGKPVIAEHDVDTFSVTVGQAQYALCRSRSTAENVVRNLLQASQGDDR